AAALAGGQDLQPVSRTALPTTNDRMRARTHALRVVLDQMVGPGFTSTCDVNNDITDCDLVPGSAYQVSIRTPALTCVNCDVNRAIEVNVREPRHPTTFARLFGQTTWNLSRTSVAGLGHAPNYTIVALRPIKPRGGSATEVRDIRLAGGARVVVLRGDVGSNSNMDYASCLSLLDLQPGYDFYYVDSPAGWGCPNPPGKHVGAMIPDPNYPIPAQPTTTYATLQVGAGQAEDTLADCQALVNAKILDVTNPGTGTATNYAYMVPRDIAGNVTWAKVHCMNPGTYNFNPVGDNLSDSLTILKPGLYWLNYGVDFRGNLIGGYDPTEPGVTLWFKRDQQFKQRSGTLALNGGSRFSRTAAFNPGGAEPATAPAMTGGNPNLKITVIVQKDPNCQVALPYNTGCSDLANKTIDLAGGTALYLAGVQYAPSDNTVISGNSSGVGYVGQIWAWTLYYNGNNTTLTQEGTQVDKPGIVRLDTACSPGEPQALCY
ncbi:MAG: hypothetical protein Q8N51_16685, partial [Gammaproteobacteria bacterium]|nr:hypothetical protein [Gammaproteobacteria bacterium]